MSLVLWQGLLSPLFPPCIVFEVNTQGLSTRAVALIFFVVGNMSCCQATTAVARQLQLFKVATVVAHVRVMYCSITVVVLSSCSTEYVVIRRGAKCKGGCTKGSC